MKKLIALMASLCLVFALAGCSGGNDTNGGTDAPSSTAEGSTPEESTSSAFGNTQSTAFFDFSANSASIAESYEDYTPAEGNQLIVINMTLTNTADYEMYMYDTDFVLLYDGEGDDNYPVAGDLGVDYDVAVGDSVTGDIVFEVPADSSAYDFQFVEQFENDTTGDAYDVNFTAAEIG